MTNLPRNPNPTPNSDVMSFSKLEIYIPEWLEYKISGKEWISWGSDNLMPKYLITMRDSSAIHNAILTKKELYTYGNGLEDGKQIPCFTHGTPETLKALISDFYVYGMWALNLVYDVNGNVIHAEHVDSEPVRKIQWAKLPTGTILTILQT